MDTKSAKQDKATIPTQEEISQTKPELKEMMKLDRNVAETRVEHQETDDSLADSKESTSSHPDSSKPKEQRAQGLASICRTSSGLGAVAVPPVQTDCILNYGSAGTDPALNGGEQVGFVKALSSAPDMNQFSNKPHAKMEEVASAISSSNERSKATSSEDSDEPHAMQSSKSFSSAADSGNTRSAIERQKLNANAPSFHAQTKTRPFKLEAQPCANSYYKRRMKTTTRQTNLEISADPMVDAEAEIKTGELLKLYILKKCSLNEHCRKTDFDGTALDGLNRLFFVQSLQAVEHYAASVSERIQKKPAYLMGILRGQESHWDNSRAAAQLEGGSIQLLNLPGRMLYEIGALCLDGNCLPSDFTPEVLLSLHSLTVPLALGALNAFNANKRIAAGSRGGIANRPRFFQRLVENVIQQNPIGLHPVAKSGLPTQRASGFGVSEPRLSEAEQHPSGGKPSEIAAGPLTSKTALTDASWSRSQPDENRGSAFAHKETRGSMVSEQSGAHQIAGVPTVNLSTQSETSPNSFFSLLGSNNSPNSVNSHKENFGSNNVNSVEKSQANTLDSLPLNQKVAVLEEKCRKLHAALVQKERNELLLKKELKKSQYQVAYIESEYKKLKGNMDQLIGGIREQLGPGIP